MNYSWNAYSTPLIKAKEFSRVGSHEVEYNCVEIDTEDEIDLIDKDEEILAGENEIETDESLEAEVSDIEPTILDEIEKNNEEVLRMIYDQDIPEDIKEQMLNDLAIKNIKTVYYVVNKFTAYSVTQDDLIGAGMLGYAKAIKKFNPHRGVKFATFAINCIKNEIRFCLRKENRHYKNNISINTVKYEDKNGGQVTIEDVIPDKRLTPDEEVAKKSLRNMIVRIIDTLSPIEKYIIIYRFGLDREIELTQKDIAEQVDMSQANISKIERGCIEKVRTLYLTEFNN